MKVNTPALPGPLTKDKELKSTALWLADLLRMPETRKVMVEVEGKVLGALQAKDTKADISQAAAAAAQAALEDTAKQYADLIGQREKSILGMNDKKRIK